jgi:TolA-binding protein
LQQSNVSEETPAKDGGSPDRITSLEQKVSQLQSEIADLKREFNTFQKQFES